jgi:transcription elongation factor GreA
MEKVPMTTEGLAPLQDELRRLKSEERPAIIKAISEAREHGDLSENAEGRIQELEDIISRADVIDVSKLSGSTVKFGATVTVADEDTDEEVTYQIVGPYEADLAKKRISIQSPIARALIGKSVGESTEVKAPGGIKGYEVIDIKYK